MSEALVHPQGLPEAGDVMDKLLSRRRDHIFGSSDADHDYVISRLNEIAPIQAYYVPTVTPLGGVAPEHIKAQWVGLRLPVRAKHTAEDIEDIEGFAVVGREGMRVLEHDRPEAHEWWRNHWSKAAKHFFMTFPATLDSKINLNFWIFKPDAGTIRPVESFLGSLVAHDEMFRLAYAKQHVGQASLRAAQVAEG